MSRLREEYARQAGRDSAQRQAAQALKQRDEAYAAAEEALALCDGYKAALEKAAATRAALVEALEELVTSIERAAANGVDLTGHVGVGKALAALALAKGEPQPGSGHPKWHEERQAGERCEHLRRYEDVCLECGRDRLTIENRQLGREIAATYAKPLAKGEGT